MELTGKTLKDFWRWYLSLEQRKTYKTSSLRGGNNAAMIRFLAMSFAERYGVYVDFFDSVGVTINISPIYYDGYCFKIHIENTNGKWLEDNKESRPEARTSVIKKANELRNE
tara:strand:+ start:43 stop:378 length:336 start_codon:yes stop_codon:yes gene_type:complete